MNNVRRRLSVLVGAMLTVLVLPSVAVAQDDGGFGTETQVLESEGPLVSVTDVRVASHDGFDRVTFDIVGDGLAGYRVFYGEDDPVFGQGGPPTVLPGDATLWVILTNIQFPPEAPPGVEPFGGEVPGPEGGVVTKIISGWFEGEQETIVGVVGELPFRVQRLEDPQQIVVDIASTPVGGVATGLGGAADIQPLGPEPTAVLALVMLSLAGGSVLVRWRRD
jgi:hypothetical protein